MTTPQFLAFLAPTLALNLTPGPDLFFVISRATKGGPKHALVAAAGLCLGYLFHIGLVCAGMAALLTKFPHLFLGIKLLGCSYLVVLGVKLLRQKNSQGTEAAGGEPSLWEGFFVSAMNPKVAIFFLAFLPQFITPGDDQVTLQLVLLGLTFSFTSSVVNLSAGLMAYRAKAQGNKTHALARRLSVEKLCGMAMMGMAMRLAFSRQ